MHHFHYFNHLRSHLHGVDDFAGRHDGRGGPFHGGRGGRGSAPFGFGGSGPGGFGFPRARKLSAADLQLVLLALLGEKARHGYDLIKAIEERSNGFYVPSPGVIYPALTYLEEAGDTVSEADGARKQYQLTDAGRAHLAKRRAEADGMLRQLEDIGRTMDRVREAFAGQAEAEDDEHPRDAWSTPRKIAAFIAGIVGHQPELAAAVYELRNALADNRGASADEWLRVADVLRSAAEDIRNIHAAARDAKR